MNRFKLTKSTALLLILSLGFLLRFVGLGQAPAGFNADETSQAYTAYSLLKTGKDEWGKPWPILSFKSFLDYKAPLQTYLMIPAIAVFGLNEFAARLPSALFGFLTLYSIYRLSLVLARKFLTDHHPHNPDTIALTATLLLAISPWHIQFSRMALEANLVGFFVITGLWLFLEGRENTRLLFISAVSFALSIYAYHSAKIFVPIFVTFLCALFTVRRRILPNLKYFAVIFLIIIFPAMADLFFGQSGTRGQDLLITKLSPSEVQEISDQRFYSPLFKISPSLPAVFHNKLSYIFDRFVENYFSYFDLSFWFTQGGREITYSIIPGRGLLHTWSVFFFLSGFVFFTRHYTNKRFGWLILGWFLLAAIPAAITKEGYRPNRASAYIGLFELIMAFGASYLVIKSKQYKNWLIGVITLVASVALVFYVNDYLLASRIKFPTTMSYGWRDAIKYLNDHQQQYDHVLIQRSGQAQTFVAFYSQMSPVTFQGNSTTWSALAEQQKVAYLDQLSEYELDRYTFKHLNFPEDIKPNTLYMSELKERLPENRHTLYRVYARADMPVLEFFTFDTDTR